MERMDTVDLKALPIAEQIVVSNLFFQLAGTFVNDPLDPSSERYRHAAALSTSKELAWHALLPTHACVLMYRQVEELVETWKSTTTMRDSQMAQILAESDIAPEPVDPPEPVRATCLSGSVFKKDRDMAMNLHQALWMQLARRFSSRSFVLRVVAFCCFNCIIVSIVSVRSRSSRFSPLRV